MTFDTIFVGSLSIDTITLAAFTAANGVRLLAYMPQIWKAAKDDNGASGISYTTWSLFPVGEHLDRCLCSRQSRGSRIGALLCGQRRVLSRDSCGGVLEAARSYAAAARRQPVRSASDPLR